MAAVDAPRDTAANATTLARSARVEILLPDRQTFTLRS
jgi:hypothetical protein